MFIAVIYVFISRSRRTTSSGGGGGGGGGRLIYLSSACLVHHLLPWGHTLLALCRDFAGFHTVVAEGVKAET